MVSISPKHDPCEGGYPWRLINSDYSTIFRIIFPGTSLARSNGIQTSTRLAVAFLGYLGLTLVLLHPITSHFATQVPHDLGDPLLSTTLLWWNAHTTPLTARWWDGFFFAPATGTIAFSDHRLGESLIASPIIWLGASPIAAYNITLLLTFPLCAIAAHGLALVVTRRHDAAILAGLAFGFSPYRFAHIEHLELLAAYGMPIALLALHQSLEDRRARWPILFALALLLQALSCSYYLLFFLVMLALWAGWFFRRGDSLAIRNAALAGGAVMIALAPIGWAYRSIHQHYGFSRGFNDIITLSADVTSYVTASPLVWLWGWTSSLNGPERQLMPGAGVVALVIAGLVTSVRRARAVPARAGALSIAALAVAAAFGVLAIFTSTYGPWQIGDGPLAVSSRTFFKPLSLAAAALVVAVAASTTMREAFRRRSPFAFYLTAALILGLCSLGPKPSFLGHQFLYEPPYAWLMRIAVFGESIRVPSRFAMPAFLSLAIAGAIAYTRLTERARVRQAVLAIAAISITLEVWSKDIPMFEPPRPWPNTFATIGAASVLDLPLGDVNHDVAALFRASQIGLPTANGNSGYQPPHYEALRLATQERDETVLSALAERGPLLVTVDDAAPDAAAQIEWLRTLHEASQLHETERGSWFLVRSRPTRLVTCGAPALPIAAIRDHHGRSITLPWISGAAQRKGDALIVDLGRAVRPCAVRLSLGRYAGLFPRVLRIGASIDGAQWTTLATEKTGGRTVLAAITRPSDPQLTIAFAGEPARFLSLQLDVDQPNAGWAVATLSVNGSLPE